MRRLTPSDVLVGVGRVDERDQAEVRPELECRRELCRMARVVDVEVLDSKECV